MSSETLDKLYLSFKEKVNEKCEAALKANAKATKTVEGQDKPPVDVADVKKRFKWDDALRNLLCEIVGLEWEMSSLENDFK